VKRQIGKSDFSFITKELNHYEETGLITTGQKDSIVNIYIVKGELNFVRIVVTIGAILVGLGVLSFIASNWGGMTKLVKLSLIFGIFIGVNAISFNLQSYPKTARSLIYLGTLVYGAGIFLIGQMFNFGGTYSTAFLLWSMGIIPMAFQQRDKYLLLFANVLFLIYLNASLSEGFPYVSIIGIPALYLALNYFGRPKLLLFFANVSALNLIGYLGFRNEIVGLYIAGGFFIIGLLMFTIRHKLHFDIFKLQGNIVFGISGIVLTLPHMWTRVSNSYQTEASTIFAIAFMILLFALIRKGSLISLLFVCLTIFRYYVDTFEFLPKSLFFMVGGLLLLGFGFYFERLRRTQKGGISL